MIRTPQQEFNDSFYPLGECAVSNCHNIIATILQDKPFTKIRRTDQYRTVYMQRKGGYTRMGVCKSCYANIAVNKDDLLGNWKNWKKASIDFMADTGHIEPEIVKKRKAQIDDVTQCNIVKSRSDAMSKASQFKKERIQSQIRQRKNKKEK